MIDRFIYKCCDVLDRYSEWVSNLLIPKPKEKKECQEKLIHF